MDHVRPALMLPDADALVVGAAHALLVTPDGEAQTLDRDRLRERLDGPPVLLVHARSVARVAGRDWVAAFDLLELFAFVMPARFCLPTPAGLADALGLPRPQSREAGAVLLFRAAERLLGLVAAPGREDRSDAGAIAAAMGRGGWPWAPFVRAALGLPERGDEAKARHGLRVWLRLPEWQAEAPPPPPGGEPVSEAEARQRLAELRGEAAEDRPQQADYAGAVAAAFTPRQSAEEPNMVLAEAGTGVGKTLGYLAPATLWSEKNRAPVWISTYTRNLQQQIDRELDRLYPHRETKAKRVVIRKGRENYLCLLNLEEATRTLALEPRHATAIGLMARWTAATRDGDLTGGDFPGWLADLIGRGRSLGLADRRGECVYSACEHWGRCFIERSVRSARRADIVVANHALVMIQAALGTLADAQMPGRYVFDEGHHLFEAADGAFAGHLTGQEAIDLRRWLIGAAGRTAGGRTRRARGLRRRVEDLVTDEETGLQALETIEAAARALPDDGWLARIADGRPAGPAEAFLGRVRAQVYARAPGRDGPYALETETTPPMEGVLETASDLARALRALRTPMTRLARSLRARLDDEADRLDTSTRQRLDAAAKGLERRAGLDLTGWIQMLEGLGETPPPAFVDWFGVERLYGRDFDLGYYRHWVDPTEPFARTLADHAQGIVVTSATLTDGTGEPAIDWQAAEERTGARHFGPAPMRVRVRSPFDYPGQTRVLVVGDVRKDDLDQVAAAYRSLFLASSGGALGLFTAITRLRAVHERIAAPLEAAEIPLLAQHVDGMDISTLIDIFRGEERSCLLGTDAVRDGVDVPGAALRLIVFDRVPWPRPTILHRARREAFGGKRYDDMLTRLRLKQAYGRLVRRADDLGVFVLLDRMMPSRLAGAFPEGVAVERVGLAEAVEVTRTFLASAACRSAQGDGKSGP